MFWWAWVELNYRPHAYQACALNQLSYRPVVQIIAGATAAGINCHRTNGLTPVPWKLNRIVTSRRYYDSYRPREAALRDLLMIGDEK